MKTLLFKLNMKSYLYVTIILFLGNLLNSQIIFDKSFENRVIKWRHEIHQNPELSNREFKTAKKIESHLRTLGIDVQTNVAHTGVVGIIKGKYPGKVLALRADMDALPVTENNSLPYRSKVVSSFGGQKTGVMHACGHDAHVAILMGAAEYLTKNNNFSGTIKLIFQPAEEGPPPGEKGGARLMIEEGVLDNPKVDAIFGLHINSATPVGVIRYKPKGFMAAAQRFVINVKGKPAHGSQPWKSVDPILISAKIIDGLQSIISRNSELTKEGAVISIGSIHSGIRFNIIPESAQMVGTIRTLDKDMKKLIIERMNELIPQIAMAYGGTASVDITESAALTYNDPELTRFAVSSLKKVLGEKQVVEVNAVTLAEDFSAFQEKIPGFYFYLGGLIQGNKSENAPSHHTPEFMIDDAGLIYGVKAMVNLSLDYLN